MKKTTRIIAAILLAAAAIIAAGCTGGPVVRDYDVFATAKNIFDNCSFEDEFLVELEDRSFALSLYDIEAAYVAEADGVKQASIYVSSAYPEMIVCIKAVDEAGAEKVMEAMQKLVKNYIENYSNYNPAQIAKLQTAVERRLGEYVIVAVTNDNEAAAKYIDSIVK